MPMHMSVRFVLASGVDGSWCLHPPKTCLSLALMAALQWQHRASSLG